MSVIACRVLPGGYEIAADSISVRGYTQRKGDHEAFGKLFEVNGLNVGGVGPSDEMSMLHVYAATRKPAAATEASLLEFLSEFASWKNDKIGEAGLNASYIIGYGLKLFAVQGWHVARVTSFEALGAGMDFALAALHLGGDVKQAVETAIELCVYCEGPVQVVRKE